MIDTQKVRACSPLLGAPAATVVAELCDEIDELRQILDEVREVVHSEPGDDFAGVPDDVRASEMGDEGLDPAYVAETLAGELNRRARIRARGFEARHEAVEEHLAEAESRIAAALALLVPDPPPGSRDERLRDALEGR